jgi:hypothetical protein
MNQEILKEYDDIARSHVSAIMDERIARKVRKIQYHVRRKSSKAGHRYEIKGLWRYETNHQKPKEIRLSQE